MENVKNTRFYNFIIILYEDDENFEKYFQNIKNECCDYVYIRHDSDIYEEDKFDEEGNIIYNSGDIKKPHYHFVVKLKVACTISSLSKKLEIPENMIENVKRKSISGALKYLIHYGYDNKYQYSQEEVKGTDKLLRKFKDLVSLDISETEKVINIQDFIEQANDYVDLGVLGRYVQKINMWDAFRRNMMYFIKIVDNHNAKITAIRYNYENPYYESEYTKDGFKDENKE